jgi:hypothetical protein
MMRDRNGNRGRGPRNEGRGGGRGGDSRYGRGNNSRGGSRGGQRREGGRPRHGGGGRSRRTPHNAYDSGNQRERIAIESGNLVIIDQFMLANRQFVEKFMQIIDEGSAPKDDLIRHYGGTIVNLDPGTYKIDRDPFKFSIIIHPEGMDIEAGSIEENSLESIGPVFVDTRCIAMIDRELLDDGSILEKYQQLWFSGQDKACRDLLRDNGGAVRYGFSRNSDDLTLYKVPSENIVCLWPENRPQQTQAEEGAAEGEQAEA